VNKKEQEEVKALQLQIDGLKHALEIVKSLHWTTPVERDVPVPEWPVAESTGWDYNARTLRVWAAWSTSSAHGELDSNSVSGSQQGRALFSTPRLALQAMRHVVEQEAALRLQVVDMMIQKVDAEATL
jgi:hypothetical protein